MLFGKRLLMWQGFHSFIITELRHYPTSIENINQISGRRSRGCWGAWVGESRKIIDRPKINRLLNICSQHLQSIKAGVKTIQIHQLIVGSRLRQTPPLEGEDAINIANGGQSVRNNNCRAIAHHPIDRRLNNRFRGHIQTGRSFI
jgi:hypothetical protein